MPPSRVRVLRFLLSSVLLGTFLVGAGALVLDRLGDVDDALEGNGFAPETTLAFDETIHEGCDGLDEVVACPETELVDEDTLDGALERYRQGRLQDSDAKYLMLTQQDYDTGLAGYLGAATPEPGGSIPLTPLWEATLEGIDAEATFTWVQQWVLGGDAILFEQVFVLPEETDVAAFTENHRNHMAGFGVEPLSGGGLGTGDVAPALYRFQDAEATNLARRCVNRAIQAVDRAVFVITLASGGDCTTPSPELPLAILASVTERAGRLLG